MHTNVITVREIQRHYRQLINRAKRTGQPVYVGAHAQEEAVLVDADSYRRLQHLAVNKTGKWEQIERTLRRIQNSKRGTAHLSAFVYADRQRH